MPIDNHILGVKYNHATLKVLKGQYYTTIYKKSKNKNIDKVNRELFYNQISIIVRPKDRPINVKLFANGSLHLTGCRTDLDAVDVVQCLEEKFQTLQNNYVTILLTRDENNVLLDRDNLIYTSSLPHKIIGYKKDSLYVINKRECIVDPKTKLFVHTKEESQRKRSLFDSNGQNVGYIQIELTKDNKKMYKKNNNIFFDYEGGVVFYNNQHVIGKINYVYTTTPSNFDAQSSVLEINFSCCPYNEGKTLEWKYLSDLDVNIHCINICFSLPYKINRQKLYDIFAKDNFICKYRPESYSGVKVIYKIQDFDNKLQHQGGKCPCSNKCICTNITFLIFQSGNIIVSGFRSFQQIDIIVNSFLGDVSRASEFITVK